MKKALLILLITICSGTFISAQQLISINPDIGPAGQTISTVVTASGFSFTWGSMPGIWGDFYMQHGSTSILPSAINLIDDDHFEAVWPIPGNAPHGNYDVIWDLFWWGGPLLIPGGFNVECYAAPAIITNPNPVYVCFGDSILTQANTGVGFSWQWYKSGIAIPGATNSSIYVTASAYYQVKVSDSQGCARFSAEAFRGFYSPPIAIITPQTNQTICQGNSVTLFATYSSNYSYQWFRNNTPIVNGTLQTLVVTDSGSYTVRITSSFGCIKISDPRLVFIGSGPPATITPSGPLTFCSGNSVNLVANAGTGYSFQWFKYGNPIVGGTFQTLIVDNAGVYKVQITQGTAACSTKSAPVTVNVIAPPAATITPQGTPDVCPGDSTRLNANIGTGFSYQWYRYGNSIAGATSSFYYAKQAGTYKVRVTNATGCSRKSSGLYITLLSAPSANITPSGPTAICAGDFVTLQANTGTGYTYYWKKYSNIIAGATSSSYNATTAGKYRVVVTAPNGCAKVSSLVNVTIVCREAFSEDLSDIEIFPNPVEDVLLINGYEISKIEIINSKGQGVIMLNNGNLNEVDVSQLQPGLYFVVIYTEKEIVKKKILKN